MPATQVLDVPTAMLPGAGVPLRTRIVRWLTAGGWSMIAVLMLIKCAGLVSVYGRFAWRLDLIDPDNYMRLAQIRDWLGGQSWYDVTQYRVAPPEGLHTHWSRLSDLPAGCLIALLTPFIGTFYAERIAVTVAPLILLVVACFLVVAIAEGLGGRRARFPAAMIALYGAKMQWEFIPGRIDHHALQIVLVLTVLAALVRGDTRRHGWIAAGATALSLGVGMETAPYLAAIAGWVALRWAARGVPVRDAALAYMGGLALLVPLVFVATVPLADWAIPKGDAIGRGHVMAAIIIGGSFAALIWRESAARWQLRLALVAALGGMGGLFILAAFPEVDDAPYKMVGPMLARLWMARIGETHTVLQDWHRSPLIAAGRLGFGIAMAALGGWLTRRSHGRARDRFALMTVLAVIGVVLSGWQFRASALGAAVAMPLAAAPVGRLLRRSLPAGIAALGGLALLLLADGLIPEPKPAGAKGKVAVAQPVADEDCFARVNFIDIARLPPGLVLGQINLAGPFLVWTQHSVLSSGIHRGFLGNRYEFETWMAPPDMARARMAARGVRYVATCDGGGEGPALAHEAPHGLIAMMRQGHIPAWLQPVAHSGDKRLRFYRFTG